MVERGRDGWRACCRGRDKDFLLSLLNWTQRDRASGGCSVYSMSGLPRSGFEQQRYKGWVSTEQVVVERTHNLGESIGRGGSRQAAVHARSQGQQRPCFAWRRSNAVVDTCSLCLHVYGIYIVCTYPSTLRTWCGARALVHGGNEARATMTIDD